MTYVIYKENDVELDIIPLVEILNTVCNFINFKIGNSDVNINSKFLDQNTSISQFSQSVSSELEKNYEMVLFSNKQYGDNYYFHSNYHHSIFSFYGIEYLTEYSKNTVAYYAITLLISLQLDDTFRHLEDGINNCIYNFSINKRDLHKMIQSSTVCDNCQTRIIETDSEDSEYILHDLVSLLEELKYANSYNDIVEYWSSNKKEKVKLFFSYAHNDREYLDEFKDYIKIFERNGLVERWDDNELIVGEKWDNTIKDKIYSADIIIFLLSASSLASDYIYNNELKIAFELNEIDEAHVIPIIIKDCLWDMTEFKDFQILPRDGKAVNSWKLREEAWTATARGLKKAIDSIISAKQQSVKNVKVNQKSSKLGKSIESAKQTDSDKEIVLKFLKTYHRWWFNIPRIINWGSEREGFSRLKSLTHEELKAILSELEKEDKIISKPSSKNKNSLLYKAK